MNLRRLSALLAAGLLASCTLTSPQDDTLGRGPGWCPAGTKRCGPSCVSDADPSTGCGALTCDPCAAPPGARAVCLRGACSLGPCDAGLGDCDSNPANGCEADILSSAQNCGGCGKVCQQAHGAVRCEAGACKIDGCDGGFDDCDKQAANGCETDLSTSPQHCGGCGKACKQGQACKQGTCVSVGGVAEWLDQRRGGFCLGSYNQFLNLCGNVGTCPQYKNICTDDDLKLPGHTCWADLGHDYSTIEGWPGSAPYCCEPSIFKKYPDGLSVDVGFHYDGTSTGLLLDAGGDSQGTPKRLSLRFDTPGALKLFMQGAHLDAAVGPGPHLLSARITAEKVTLVVDGVTLAEGPGPQEPPELIGSNGPGLILGQRISFWFEPPAAIAWLRAAPFFFHLREGVAPGAWSLEESTTESERTLLLLNEEGVKSDRWEPQKGPLTAVPVDGRLGEAPEPPLSRPFWIPKIAGVCF